MAQSGFSFTAEVWEHEGPAAWHFVSLPEAVADEIEATYGHRAGGFGSVRVEVTIGKTRWLTSLFPDRRRASYVLPLKKEVRVAEQLVAGAPANVSVVVVDQ